MLFCAFGGEEIGLFGSTNFVNKRRNDFDKIISYVNLDSTSGDLCYIHELVTTKTILEITLKLIREYTNWNITQYHEFNECDKNLGDSTN